MYNVISKLEAHLDSFDIDTTNTNFFIDDLNALTSDLKQGLNRMISDPFKQLQDLKNLLDPIQSFIIKWRKIVNKEELKNIVKIIDPEEKKILYEKHRLHYLKLVPFIGDFKNSTFVKEIEDQEYLIKCFTTKNYPFLSDGRYNETLITCFIKKLPLSEAIKYIEDVVKKMEDSDHEAIFQSPFLETLRDIRIEIKFGNKNKEAVRVSRISKIVKYLEKYNYIQNSKEFEKSLTDFKGRLSFLNGIQKNATAWLLHQFKKLEIINKIEDYNVYHDNKKWPIETIADSYKKLKKRGNLEGKSGEKYSELIVFFESLSQKPHE